MAVLAGTAVRGCAQQLRFDVLGPLRVRCGSDTMKLVAAKHRTVMALLLIHANRVVSADNLVSELWEDRPPATARKTVQGYIWRLRCALGPFGERLVTDSAGYRLVVADGRLDATTFESLVAAGRSALKQRRYHLADRYLRQAATLWRGPAFADVAPTPAVGARVARLEEVRLAADELRIEADLAVGDHHAAIPELTDLAMRHTARESIHRLLMIALFRAGRRAEALSAFARLRTFLIEEYGVAPASETSRLHQWILRADRHPD